MTTIEIDGRRLAYTDTGGGADPVLLVHAFPLHGGMWEGQMEALGSRHRLVAMDLMGFGASSAPEDPTAYAMDSYATDLARLLDELGARRVTLVGLSMGGYIAFAFWRRFKERVAGLVLADTRAEADPPEGIEKRSNQQQQVLAEGTEKVIEALAGALLSPATREGKPDVEKRVRELMDNPAAGFVGGLEAMKRRVDSTADLATIDVPTLVIVGESDGLTPPEAARKIHEHVRGSRLVTIPEAGHLSSLEAPDHFNGALAEFLGESSR